MLSRAVKTNPELMRAYVEYERELAIDKCRVACLLGVVFMPSGILLDYFIYPEKLQSFLGMRLLCSVYCSRRFC